MPHRVFDATACVLNGRFYVLGGYDCNKLQVLEMSEENEFSWSVKDLPPAAYRYEAASVILGGKVWLMGGSKGGSLASVLIYDVLSDSWAMGPPLPRAIRCCHATTLNGEIFVTGCDREDDGDESDDTTDSEDSEFEIQPETRFWFAYRNAAWLEVAGPTDQIMTEGGRYPCESVLLG